MLFGMLFVFWRFCQILTLIPTMGMLAWFVNTYNDRNALSPDWLLVLFITSVLALAWTLFTLFSYHRSKNNAFFVGFVDLLFVGAFIAGVYYLRWIRNQDCSSVSQSGTVSTNLGDFASITVQSYSWNLDKSCAMLKASWAFAIMNVFFFFFTAVLAMLHGNDHDDHRHHGRRHSHRGGSRGHSSRRSSHSRHSHRRVFV